MKITFLIPSLHGGGIEIMLRDLINNFAENNYDIDLIIIYPSKNIFLNKKINLIQLNKKRIIFSIFDIYKYMLSSETKIIFSFFHTTSALLKFLRNFSLKKPKLLFQFTNNLSYQNSNIKSNKNKFNFIDKICNFYILNGKNKNTIYQSVSQGIANDLKNNWKFNKKINVIYNPININNIEKTILKKLHQNKIKEIKDKYIIAIGRLTYQKNFDLLIYVFSKIYKELNIKLVILGEGEDRKKLETLVKKLNLTKEIIFLGYINAPYYILSKAELMILCSRYEGFGIVLAESLACNTNIISSDCNYGPSEILENGKWGDLFPVGDKEGLKKLIIKNINNPPNKNIRLRAEEFDIKKISEKYFELIN